MVQRQDARAGVEGRPTSAEQGSSESARADAAASGTVPEALSRGLAELVEGQRQFAEEFGLPYERVFTTAFEPFKGRDTGAVIHEWLSSDTDHAEEVRILLRDLADHQWALIAALESFVAAQSAPQRGLGVTDMWAWLAGRRRATEQTSAMPRLVTAYARGRESASAGHCNDSHRGEHGSR